MEILIFIFSMIIASCCIFCILDGLLELIFSKFSKYDRSEVLLHIIICGITLFTVIYLFNQLYDIF